MSNSGYHKISKNQSYHFLFGFIGLLFCISTSMTAQGDLLLFPKRVVFEGGKRTEIINLINIGNDTMKYNISFVQIRMKDNGSFENISEPDSNQFFALPYIRYYPRTVTLAPHESQVVKLQITGTSALLPGEYRSHLYFRAEPSNQPIAEKEIPTDTTALSVRLIPVYGMTIPCIIRIGEYTTTVALSNLSFEWDKDLKPNISMEFNRTGNMSVYGNIVVNYISTEGKTTKVGEVMGFAVYTPGTLRKCTIKLLESEGVDYTSGELTVVYTSPPTSKSIKLASANFAFIR